MASAASATSAASDATRVISHDGSLTTTAFHIFVISMTGAAIVIRDATATDTIRSVKERVFAVNRKLHVRRQRLMYRPGPCGIEPLADNETLGGAGVARDGSAELDVLLVDLTEAEVAELGLKLIEAAKVGRSDEVLQLMDESANFDFANQSGKTALIVAAKNGHADCVRLLMDAGADKEAKSEDAETALLSAAANGQAKCTQLLIDAGADKETKNWLGHTALISAAQHCHADCVLLLLNAGANTEAKSHSRLISRTELNIMGRELAKAVGSGETALIAAAASAIAAADCKTDCVRLLLDGGADKDAKADHGYTALIRAAKNGHAACVRLLLEAGTDKDAKNVWGHTALMVAADGASGRGHADCVRLLVNAGADKQAKDTDNMMASDWYHHHLDFGTHRRDANVEILNLLAVSKLKNKTNQAWYLYFFFAAVFLGIGFNFYLRLR